MYQCKSGCFRQDSVTPHSLHTHCRLPPCFTSPHPPTPSCALINISRLSLSPYGLSTSLTFLVEGLCSHLVLSPPRTTTTNSSMRSRSPYTPLSRNIHIISSGAVMRLLSHVAGESHLHSAYRTNHGNTLTLLELIKVMSLYPASARTRTHPPTNPCTHGRTHDAQLASLQQSAPTCFIKVPRKLAASPDSLQREGCSLWPQLPGTFSELGDSPSK